MKELINSVKEFYSYFGLPSKTKPSAKPPKGREVLRYSLMKEENEEYLEAAQNNDLVEVADALGDMLYILCGTIIEHGMQHKIEEVFNEIQRSNMSKLGEDGKPIYREDGKVLKGPNYFKPDIKKILKSKPECKVTIPSYILEYLINHHDGLFPEYFDEINLDIQKEFEENIDYLKGYSIEMDSDGSCDHDGQMIDWTITLTSPEGYKYYHITRHCLMIGLDLGDEDVDFSKSKS